MNQDSLLIGPRALKWLKALHLILVSAALGGAWTLLILITAASHLDLSGRAGLHGIILAAYDASLVYPFLALIGTGLAYGLFTRWGFTRHWWILAKWSLVLALFALTWFRLGPAVNGMAAITDGEFSFAGSRDLYEKCLASGTSGAAALAAIMATIILLSVLKPWGARSLGPRPRRRTVMIAMGIFITLGIAMTFMQWRQLVKYRALPVTSADLSRVRDGAYEGVADYGFEYRVRVRIESHRIVEVKVLQNRESAYAHYAEGVVPKILRAQRADVDAVTGATTTSKILMKAVEKALEDAEGE